jgi:hypothetical protein
MGTDTLVPPVNSFELAAEIENTELHIYSDVGHAFLFQYGALVAEHTRFVLGYRVKVDGIICIRILCY